MHLAAAAIAIVVATACGPRRADHEAMIARLGPAKARAELRFRIASDPRDLHARLALAWLDEASQRPGSAIEQLLAVERAGGPFGPRWSDDDRRRLANLLVARARVRAARGAASAVDDLAHAKKLGATIEPALHRDAELAAALADLRHASNEIRDRGMKRLATLSPERDPNLAGSVAGASRADHGRFGSWLWDRGARRAALDVLERWRAAGGRDDDDAVERWLRARRWWSVPDDERLDADRAPDDFARARRGVAPAPPGFAPVAGDPRFPCLPAAEPVDAACSPVTAATGDVDGPVWEPDLVAASETWRSTTDAATATAWVVVTLRHQLRGGASWLAALSRRVDAVALAANLPALPVHVRPTLLRAAGRDDDAARMIVYVLDDPNAIATPQARLVLAAEAAVAGVATARIRRVLGDVATSRAGGALMARVEPAVAAHADDYAAVAGLGAARRAGRPAMAATLSAIARAYEREPAVADRLVDDALAAEIDDAAAHAAIALLFEAVGDLGRARLSWQRAVDSSDEPRWRHGLGEAAARAGDGDAALIYLIEAAAGSGDAAPILIAGARALLDGGQHVHAVELGHQAMTLAGPDTIADAIAVTADASAALGRTEQTAALRALRPLPPIDADAAVVAAAARPGAVATADLVVAARWHPRHVAVRAAVLATTDRDDPRNRRARAELAELALDADVAVSRAALRALRPTTTTGSEARRARGSAR